MKVSVRHNQKPSGQGVFKQNNDCNISSFEVLLEVRKELKEVLMIDLDFIYNFKVSALPANKHPILSSSIVNGVFVTKSFKMRFVERLQVVYFLQTDYVSFSLLLYIALSSGGY